MSFDGYGTLIDGEKEILCALKNLLSNREIDFTEDGILEPFAEVESELQNHKNSYIRYREILKETVSKTAS